MPVLVVGADLLGVSVLEASFDGEGEWDAAADADPAVAAFGADSTLEVAAAPRSDAVLEEDPPPD